MVISKVIIRVTPFRALITLLITYLLSPLPLQVGLRTLFRAAMGSLSVGMGTIARIRVEFGGIPIGPIVVPFWDYLIGFYI